jgi:hypothetical protein
MKIWIDLELAKEVRAALFMYGIVEATAILYDDLNSGPLSLDGYDCKRIVLALEQIDLEKERGKVLVRL